MTILRTLAAAAAATLVLALPAWWVSAGAAA